jgi:hypothetical protein
MTCLPLSTIRRVPDHTAADVNERIQERTRGQVAHLAGATAKEIEQRLHELDHEWVIERVLEANASMALLLSLAGGATVNRRWYALTAVIAGFLLQHAVQGWCPPMPLLWRLGFRTSYEIDEERYALSCCAATLPRSSGPRPAKRTSATSSASRPRGAMRMRNRRLPIAMQSIR